MPYWSEGAPKHVYTCIFPSSINMRDGPGDGQTNGLTHWYRCFGAQNIYLTKIKWSTVNFVTRIRYHLVWNVRFFFILRKILASPSSQPLPNSMWFILSSWHVVMYLRFSSLCFIGFFACSAQLKDRKKIGLVGMGNVGKMNTQRDWHLI